MGGGGVSGAEGRGPGGGEGALSAGEPAELVSSDHAGPELPAKQRRKERQCQGRTCDRERGLGVCALAHRGLLSQI